VKSVRVGLVVALGALAMLTSQAQAIIVSNYGDKDGFGFGAPEVDGGSYLAFGGAFFTDYRDAGDLANAPLTDIWDTLIVPTWTHVYDPTGATSASLRIYLAGIADDDGGARDCDLLVDGDLLAPISYATDEFETTHILEYNIPLGYIDGSTTFSFTANDDAVNDGYIIDYARLTVVPEPATLALLLIGIPVIRRRR